MRGAATHTARDLSNIAKSTTGGLVATMQSAMFDPELLQDGPDTVLLQSCHGVQMSGSSGGAEAVFQSSASLYRACYR